MWEYNTLEMLQDFVREPLSMRTIRMFMEHFELNMYELPHCMRNASNLALVYGESDYAFTSDDLMWLSSIGDVALCKGEKRNLFFVDLAVNPEEYYISSAAAIKIFNVVFPGNNQYIFKSGTALASGCKRSINRRASNNFCVTQLYEFEKLKEYVYFFEEALLADEELLPQLIMQYSPQERLPERVSNKRKDVSLDYIRFLRELNTVYGVDTSKEYARYVESFAQTQSSDLTYTDVCAILHFVGESQGVSSYDVLEDALDQMVDSRKVVQNRSLIEYMLDNDTKDYSPEAFEDAELLLKEMLRNG